MHLEVLAESRQLAASAYELPLRASHAAERGGGGAQVEARRLSSAGLDERRTAGADFKAKANGDRAACAA